MDLSDPSRLSAGHSVLDVFAAPGGMSVGFKEAGYRIVAAIDNDRWGCKTLSRNLGPEGTLVIEANVEDLHLNGRVDVVVGGPPCQSFSIAGQSKIKHLKNKSSRDSFIDDERNTLYKYFVRTVDSVKPQFFVMENVPAIETFEEGRVCRQIMEDFRRAGYHTDERILNSADFGVPQVRKRAVFIGNRVGVNNPFPVPTHLRPLIAKTGTNVENSDMPHYRTVFDAISDLPPLMPGCGEDEIVYPAHIALTDYQIWARAGSTRLYNHVSRRHSERDQTAFASLEPGQKMVDLPLVAVPYRRDIFLDKIKKQRWDRPSSAIVAHMQKDGLMYVHPDRDQTRTFTPREAARIQSFRDGFRIMGPLTQQFKQIGNAVPPLAAESIARGIKPWLDPIKDPRVAYEIALQSTRLPHLSPT
jgi:DNA (cytosine-5)-methyltransferase 1